MELRPPIQQRSQSQAEAFLGRLPAPICLARNGELLFCNEAARRLLGSEVTSLSGLFVARDADVSLEQIFSSGAPFDVAVRMRRSTGDPLPVNLSGWEVQLEDGPALQLRIVDASTGPSSANPGFQLSESLGGIARWEWDVATNEVYWSEGQYVLMGYSPDTVVPKYQLWRDTVLDDVEAIERQAQEAVEAGRDYKFEYRIRRPDGSVRWLESRGHVLKPSPGRNDRRVVGVTVDITDRKLAELELERVREESRRRHVDLERIYGTIPIGLAYLDTEGRYVYVNEIMARLNGHPAADHVGRSVDDILPSPAAAFTRAMLEKVTSSGKPLVDLEVRVATMDDPSVERDWLVHYYPVGSPTVTGVHVLLREITDRKQQEAELRESTERLQASLDASSTGTFRWDIRSNALHWDHNLNQLFGLPAGDTARNLDRFISLVHPEDRERVIDGCQQCASLGVDFDMEFRVVYPDGSVHWLYDRGKTFFDETGAPLYMTGACVDITDRKTKELELKVREETIRLALQSGAAGTFEWDIVNDIDTWSPEIEALYGYAPGTFPGRYENWLACVHPDDRKQADESVRASFSTGDFSGEWRIVRRDSGALRWISARGRVLRDEYGSPLRMIGLNTDITERKIIDQQLRRGAQILDQIHDAVIGTDLNGVITLWNKGAELRFGYTLEEALGQSVSLIYFPEDRPKLISDIIVPLKAKGAHELEVRNRRKDGSEFFGHLSLSMLKDGDGNHIGMIGYTMDLTEKKRAERALRISEKLAATGRLASTLAHEINNPLEALTNIVYLLRHCQLSSAEAQDSLNMAESELTRISNITRNLLAFHRQPARPTDISLKQLIPEVLQLHKTKLDMKQISVRTRFRNEGTVLAYSGEMRQVISNLINNAIEASSPGGKITLAISSAASGGCVRFTIGDNGHGIREESLEHIFEPFYTTKGDKGTGLGLWVTKDLVEKNSGRIGVRSNRRGTFFTVKLPAAAQALETAV